MNTLKPDIVGWREGGRLDEQPAAAKETFGKLFPYFLYRHRHRTQNQQCLYRHVLGAPLNAEVQLSQLSSQMTLSQCTDRRKKK